MRDTVIPAPARFDAAGGREFVFRPGTAVGYTDTGLAPMVGRFCSQITRRTGLRLAPRAGRPVPDEASVTIELAAGDDLRALPAPGEPDDDGDGTEQGLFVCLPAEDLDVARFAVPGMMSGDPGRSVR